MGIIDQLFGGKTYNKKDVDLANTALGEKDFSKINPGDMLSIEGEDYKVLAKLVWWQSGYQWYDYKVDKGDGKDYWFSAAKEEGKWILAILKEEKPIMAVPPNEFEVNGKRYILKEKGEAQVSVFTKDGLEGKQHVKYWEWEDEKGEELVCVEDWNEGVFSVSEGYYLLESEVDIYQVD